jgi:HD superfamily phosphohydrolase
LAKVRVRDSIFGVIDLPGYLDGLLTTPEFRRLSEVRLINVNSPSLSSLSETKRYSHTLGVMRLALENPMLGFDESERKALLAAIVVHDAATPAFAHLFEYFLMDRFAWDHESAIPDLLIEGGDVDPLSTQIYFSKTPQFERLCKAAKVDIGIVMEIIRGQHPLSRLVFGSIDFDNLDNVARMNWMLGYPIDRERILSIAKNLGASANVGLILPESERRNLSYWLDLRRQAYEVLVFDAPTVSAQAVLSKVIRHGLETGDLGLQDWMYSDHEMIDALRSSSIENKKMLDKDFLGPLPEMYLLHHFQDPDHAAFAKGRDDLVELAEQFMKEEGVSGRIYGYSFRDKGAFSKRIEASDPNNGATWTVGEKSDSLVVYGFTSKPGRYVPSEAGRRFADWITRL